jgi:DNA-binding CsgD family transcriptional regulator
MKADAAFGDMAINDISSAVLAIGRPAFPQVLISALRRVADVGHCMVFSFAGEHATNTLLDAGNIPIGRDLGVAYSEHFPSIRPQPRYDLRRAWRRGTHPAADLRAPHVQRQLSQDVLRGFRHRRQVRRRDLGRGHLLLCELLQDHVAGPLHRDQIRRLLAVAPAVSAAVARHFQPDAAPDGDPMRRLKDLFATGEPLAALTGRETEVCLRILSGFSSEAIAADLGISLHSALTYRKRAYDRLGISSQNELFGIVLRLMASRSLN